MDQLADGRDAQTKVCRKGMGFYAPKLSQDLRMFINPETLQSPSFGAV